MSEIAIQVQNLSKQYRIGSHQHGDQRFGYKSLRDVLTDAVVSPLRRAGGLLRGQATAATDMHELIWALQEISIPICGRSLRDGSGANAA